MKPTVPPVPLSQCARRLISLKSPTSSARRMRANCSLRRSLNSAMIAWNSASSAGSVDTSGPGCCASSAGVFALASGLAREGEPFCRWSSRSRGVGFFRRIRSCRPPRRDRRAALVECPIGGLWGRTRGWFVRLPEHLGTRWFPLSSACCCCFWRCTIASRPSCCRVE